MATTCARCNQAITDASSAMTHKQKKYHPECFKAMIAVAQKNDAAKAERGMKINSAGERELLDYICHLFGTPSPSPLVTKQITEYRVKYGYTHESILQALRYFYEFGRGQDETQESGAGTIGIVPYIYDEAMQFWAVMENAIQYNAAVLLQNRTVVVKIRPRTAPITFAANMEDL